MGSNNSTFGPTAKTFPDVNFCRRGILMLKGGEFMKGLAISMGLGAAVGAIAVMMLPRQSSARKLVNKAANATQDAVQRVSNKISEAVDM